MSMDCNLDEATRAKNIAEKKMQVKDFAGARRLALKAQHLESNLTNISQMLLVCEVHCASETKLAGNEMDWYAILQVGHTADEATIKKQYRKLALQLHPDKNSFPGAEAAFKLIGEAQTLLLDTQKRYIHDAKRNAYLHATKRSTFSQQKTTCPTNSNPGFSNGYSYNYVKVNLQQQSNTVNGSARASFWTICPVCSVKFQYAIETINKLVVCQSCKRTFVASESLFTTSFPMQRTTPASPKSKDENFEKPKKGNDRKKRRHHESSSSESFKDDKSETDEEDGEFKAEFNVEASSDPPRRSCRNKQNVSYKEALSEEDEEDEENDTTASLPEGEFNNFNKIREEHCFSRGQIWALYDTHDGMPRLYARIERVFTKSFKLQIKRLEAEDTEGGDVENACGVFINSQTEGTDDVAMFSHEMRWESWSRNKYKICPRTGDIWGLYKGSIVEITSDMSDGEWVEGAYLEKIDGFLSLYRRSAKEVRLLEKEMDRFSHRIPAFVMSGTEKVGVPKGSFELDPAALPSSSTI